MKLYYAPGACSLAPHIALREAGRHFDLERVDLKTRRTSSGANFLGINPRGDVPALQLDGPGSDVLVENAAVLQYIGDLAPEKLLVPPNGTFARYQLQSWLSFISGETIGQHLLYLEEVLVGRAYLMGERFTVADAYLFVVLQWGDKLDMDLKTYPNLDDYEFRISQRPAVQQAMAAEGLRGRHHWKKSA
ncbi:MAG: glutathione binding-like protein [Myxococcota bacterium]|nr:glutathione binding-like protein [Myxococcota bacterium]